MGIAVLHGFAVSCRDATPDRRPPGRQPSRKPSLLVSPSEDAPAKELVMPRVCLWIVAACAALCFQGPAGAKPISVTFINPGGNSAFWGDVVATMEAAANDLDIELEVLHTDRDRIRMVEAAREIAQRATQPDYVVIVNELQQAPPMLRALEAADLPVFVLLNRLTAAQRSELSADGNALDGIVGSVVPDNEVAGFEMAQSLIARARALRLDRDGISMLALLGDAATPAALEREAGLMRAIAMHDDVDLVRAFPVMWNEDVAFERTSQALARLPIDAIWAANDQISFGAQRAAAAHGQVPGETMVFAGLNWSNAALEAVRAGEMTMSHGGHFFAGAWAMVILRDLEEGRLEPGRHIRFPMSAIDHSNVDLFLELLGSRQWNAIDFKRFSLAHELGGAYNFSGIAIVSAAATANLN